MAKRSLRQGSGFFEIDHRESPGITAADVAHLPPLLRELAVPGGQRLERDVQQCRHCQRMILLNPFRAHDRGYCPKCDHYICDDCEAARVQTGTCTPIDKIFDLTIEHVEAFRGREDNPESLIVLTDVP